MPRYFFNVYDGHDDIDDVGIEVLGLERLRREAVRFAGDVLTEDATSIHPGEDWSLEVVNEDGLVIFRVKVLLEAPSVTKLIS